VIKEAQAVCQEVRSIDPNNSVEGVIFQLLEDLCQNWQ